MSHIIVDVSCIKEIINRSFEVYDLSQKHREFMSVGLLNPSLQGIDSHGVGLLETYLKELEGGRANPHPNISFDNQFPAVAHMNAGHALGIVAGYEAVSKGIELARQNGISAISVTHSNHFGAASNYSIYAAERGYMCICMSNADSLVACHNGGESIFGTNPISFAAPGTDGELFSLDMATSQVSLSKILQFLATEQEIDESWASDIDIKNKKIGALKPLGGYKGQGLAMMVTILTSVLNSSLFDWEMNHLYTPPFDHPRFVSHFFITINIKAFTSMERFCKNMDVLLHKVRTATKLSDKPVWVAGDREKETAKERLEKGIPLTAAQYEFYQQLAMKLSIDFT